MQLITSTTSRSPTQSTGQSGATFLQIAHHDKLQVFALQAAAPSGSNDWMNLWLLS